MKRIDFRKGDQSYVLEYGDVKNLINCLVDYADDPRYNLDLMDVFLLVHRLARQRSEELLRESI